MDLTGWITLADLGFKVTDKCKSWIDSQKKVKILTENQIQYKPTNHHHSVASTANKISVSAYLIYPIVSDLKDRIWHRNDENYLDRISSPDCGGLFDMSKTEEKEFRTNVRNAVHWLSTHGNNPAKYQKHFERCFHRRELNTKES